MSLWLPNTTVLFTTFYLIFSSLAIVYITTLVCAQKHTARSSTPQFLMIVLWPPMFYAVSLFERSSIFTRKLTRGIQFLTQIWGMAGALAMTQPVFGFKLKPWLINAITLVCIVGKFSWSSDTASHSLFTS